MLCSLWKQLNLIFYLFYHYCFWDKVDPYISVAVVSHCCIITSRFQVALGQEACPTCFVCSVSVDCQWNNVFNCTVSQVVRPSLLHWKHTVFILCCLVLTSHWSEFDGDIVMSLVSMLRCVYISFVFVVKATETDFFNLFYTVLLVFLQGWPLIY